MLQVATRIGIYHKRFFEDNFISISFKKLSLVGLLFNQDTGILPTAWIFTKHYRKCFHEGALKKLHQKLWKYSRKTYVWEFLFDKFARPQSIAHRTRNSTTDTFSWKCLGRKECSNISKTSKSSLCKTTPFSLTLQACSSEFLLQQNQTQKKKWLWLVTVLRNSCRFTRKKAYNEAILLK